MAWRVGQAMWRWVAVQCRHFPCRVIRGRVDNGIVRTPLFFFIDWMKLTGTSNHSHGVSTGNGGWIDGVCGAEGAV